MDAFYRDETTSIYNADCRELSSVFEKTALVVTDPPFNIGYHYDEHNDRMDRDAYEKLIAFACRTPCVVIHYMEELCQLSLLKECVPDKVVAWVYPSNTARQWRGVAWWGGASRLYERFTTVSKSR